MRRALLLSPLVLVACLAAATPGRADDPAEDPPFDAPIHVDDAVLPKPTRTPGETLPKANLKELCASAPDVTPPAPPAVLCDDAFAAYRIRPEQRFQYACRFLVPPRLGGALSVANVWPQIAAEAVLKDRLDRDIARRACNEELPLASAQREIAGDWIAAYRKYLIPDDPAPIVRVHEPVAHAHRKRVRDDVATVYDPAADAAIAAAGGAAGGGYGYGYGSQNGAGGYGGGGGPGGQGAGGYGSGAGGASGGGYSSGQNDNAGNRQGLGRYGQRGYDGVGRQEMRPGSYAPLIDRYPRQSANLGNRASGIGSQPQASTRQTFSRRAPAQRFGAGRGDGRRR